MGLPTIAGYEIERVEGPVLCRSERRVIGRVRMRSAESVAEVVKECGFRGWRVHPISSGMNWGMGSYLPEEHDRLIVDLGELKAIGPIDQEAGTVRIEAGVTQAELYEWLKQEAPEFAFNVTGASEKTSIVGNAMERGIGYDGSRADELFGHEVVLRNGERHIPDAEWFSSTGSIPVGPRIDTLWSQSGHGIVTAAWLKLRRRQALELAIVLTGGFEPLVDTLQKGYRRGLLSLPVHMAGNERAEQVSAGLLKRLWGREPSIQEVRRVFAKGVGHTAIATIRGEKRVVLATLRELRRVGAAGVKIQAVSESELTKAEAWTRRLRLKNRADFMASVRPILAMTWGEPSDAGMVAVPGLDAEDPDKTETGFVYFNGVSPMSGKVSLAVENEIRAHFKGAHVTRVFEAPNRIYHICSIEFPPAESAEYHERLNKLLAILRRKGWPPYRSAVWTTASPRGTVAERLATAFSAYGQEIALTREFA